MIKFKADFNRNFLQDFCDAMQHTKKYTSNNFVKTMIVYLEEFDGDNYIIDGNKITINKNISFLPIKKNIKELANEIFYDYLIKDFHANK